MLKPRSLQTRILALFLVLLVGVQLGGFVLINTVGVAAARKSTGDDLLAGTQLFSHLLDQERERLMQGARLLAGDFAFRDAIASRDRARLGAALAEHGRRVDAGLVMLIGLDQHVIGDTVDAGADESFMFPRLLAEAQQYDQASAMVVVRGQLYQLAIVPVLAALNKPTAWLAVGFPVNDVLAREMRKLMRLDLSFLSRFDGGSWILQGSTLDRDARAALLAAAGTRGLSTTDELGNTTLDDGAVAARAIDLPAHTDDAVIAVLQQPVASALEPFRRLQAQLAFVSAIAVALSIAVALVVARGIARPVRELSAAAQKIAAGDYSTPPPDATRTREIGDLACAFRTMQEKIASRESRILDLAYRDGLTALPNRALYIERLESALVRAVSTKEKVAVVLMDLDHFKYVNDTLGHSIGDLLLSEVAQRIVMVVRGHASIVARMGGDEFGILVPGVGEAEIRELAQSIGRALETPMSLHGHMVDVRASLGIAVFPEHGEERSTLLRHADAAMYAAKRNNTGFMLWDPRYDAHSADRLSLMTDLRKAVDQGQLTLVYQPKVALFADAQMQVEALVRWQHPARGLVPPAEFIPFAEQTGYIRAITHWVLNAAMEQCAAWRAEGHVIDVSINISARDLLDHELPDRFAALLERHGCSASWIGLEITESAILDDPGHAIENLQRLHTLGCRVAIDDYGTGYSSLGYLRRLPLHELKIDKSFVMGMTKDPSDGVIVRSTIDLAHNMGLVVVAEGVEDEPTLERLRALGCDMVQGFFLSRPLVAADVLPWMRGGVRGRDSTLRRVV